MFISNQKKKTPCLQRKIMFWIFYSSYNQENMVRYGRARSSTTTHGWTLLSGEERLEEHNWGLVHRMTWKSANHFYHHYVLFTYLLNLLFLWFIAYFSSFTLFQTIVCLLVCLFVKIKPNDSSSNSSGSGHHPRVSQSCQPCFWTDVQKLGAVLSPIKTLLWSNPVVVLDGPMVTTGASHL